MVPKIDKKQPSLDEILKELKQTRFHGNITIHYTNGQPRKIEYKTVKDLSESKEYSTTTSTSK